MIPDGCNSHKGVINTQYDPCLDVIEETEIIPVGRKSHRKAGNIQHHPLKIEDTLWKKDTIHDEWSGKRLREASNNQYDHVAIDKI